MNKELDEELQKNYYKNLHTCFGNDIYLNQYQIEVLNRYGFECQGYSTLKDLMRDIEAYLQEGGDIYEDLDQVSNELSEFKYYHDVKK